MNKKLLFLLTPIVFLGIAFQLTATDIARAKLEDILRKTGAIDAAFTQQHYIEVTPNGEAINFFNTDHEFIKSKPLPEYLRKALSDNHQDKINKEKIDFACYHLGTKLQMQPLGEENLKKESRTTREWLFSTMTEIVIIDGFTRLFIMPHVLQFCNNRKYPRDYTNTIGKATLYSIHAAWQGFRLYDYVTEKRKKEEIIKQTFFNLGLHTDNDYSELLEDKNALSFRKAFENGREKRQEEL